MKRPLACLSGLLCSAIALAATPNRCEDLPPTRVTLKRIEAPIVENYTLSYQALKGLSQQYDQHGQFVLGLTRTQAIAKIGSQSAVLREAKGQWECATHQLEVSFGYQPMTLYVSREFAPGSCAFQQIYEHEMRHVRTYQSHAKLIEAEIAEVLRQRFEGAPVSRGRPGEIQARLQDELQTRWVPYLNRMLEKVHAEQRLIDTREEYDKVAASCGGIIGQVLSRSR